jgi:hypothetical protein
MTAFFNCEITSVGEDVEKLTHSYVAGRSAKCCSSYENSSAVPEKLIHS